MSSNSFSIKGFDRLEKDIKNIEHSYNTAIREGGLTTFLDAAAVATRAYRDAKYDGVNDIVVNTPRWTSDKTISLTAGGTSLLFIEFGSGIRYWEPYNPYASKFLYTRGTYGKGLANKRNGLWIYKTPAGNELKGPDGARVLDHRGNVRNGYAWSGGNPATNGMYSALKEIEHNLTKNIGTTYDRYRK